MINLVTDKVVKVFDPEIVKEGHFITFFITKEKFDMEKGVDDNATNGLILSVDDEKIKVETLKGRMGISIDDVQNGRVVVLGVKANAI